MKPNRYVLLFFLLFSLSWQPALSQVPADIQAYRAEPKGNVRYRREGTMDGNRVRTLFYNNGEVGMWPYQPSGEWPKGSGHSFIDGYCVLVAARVVAPGNGQVIHPLETSYREEMDRDPVTSEIWGFEPVPGYADSTANAPALSSNPATWPTAWGGKWYGMEGADSLNATLETYFVLDDSKDAEFARAPYSFHPVTGDPERKGLGLRVEARGFQWADPIAQDILMFVYDVINLSDVDYDSTAFGVYMDIGVGGTNNSGNSALFDSIQNLVYAWNPSGHGVPDGYPTGYMGILFPETPAKAAPDSGRIGISSFSTFILTTKGPTGVWPKNDDVMWGRMTGGVLDTAQNTNISIIVATGPFAMKKWSRERFSVALVFADDLLHLLPKVATARQIAALGYHLPVTTDVDPVVQRTLPASVELVQNYPNPFNPTTLIRYQLPVASRVRLVVYDLLGREVATLVNERKEAGVHEVTFDAGRLSSGVYFYRLKAGEFLQTEKMLLMK